MKKLQYKNDEKAINRLSKAQSAIDEYSASHPNELSEKRAQRIQKTSKRKG